jgi:hypothetical protein
MRVVRVKRNRRAIGVQRSQKGYLKSNWVPKLSKVFVNKTVRIIILGLV